MRRRYFARVLSLTRYRSVTITSADVLGLGGDMQDIRTGRRVAYNIHAYFGLCRETGARCFQRWRSRTSGQSSPRSVGISALKGCNGEDEHVHLLVIDPPKVTLSKLVNSLKGVSSRLLREQRPEIIGHYSHGVLWPPSCFAASCGGPLSAIAESIKSQRETPSVRPRLRSRPEGRGFTRGDR
jgi:putative transposase